MALALLAAGMIQAADDLLLGCLAADRIVRNALAHHVHAHIGGRAVGRAAPDVRKNSLQHRENLDITVIIDRRFAVGFQVEGIDHVHVVQVGRGGFIGHVDRMHQRQVPDGEGFKLGVARLDSMLVFVIQLGQAGGHLAAARAGGRHQHQRAGGFHILIAAVTLVAYNQIDIIGIARNGIMAVHAHAQGFQALLEGDSLRLAVEARQHHAAHIHAHAAESVDQAQHIRIIGNAQVAAHLVFFNIVGIDHDHQLSLIAHGQQHGNFAVRPEARQHAGSMVIIKQLAAQLQIELAAKLADALPNMLRLHARILIVIKTDFHVCPSPCSSFPQKIPNTSIITQIRLVQKAD